MTQCFCGWTIKSHSPGYEVGPIQSQCVDVALKKKKGGGGNFPGVARIIFQMDLDHHHLTIIIRVIHVRHCGRECPRALGPSGLFRRLAGNVGRKTRTSLLSSSIGVHLFHHFNHIARENVNIVRIFNFYGLHINSLLSIQSLYRDQGRVVYCFVLVRLNG